MQNAYRVSGVRRMRFVILGLVLLGIFAAPAAADPLPADQAFQIRASRTTDGKVRVDWTIADGYYLYRAHIAAKGVDGSDLKVETPQGSIKDDPVFGATEVYYRRASATVVAASEEPIEITYQGCQEGGICYVPQTKRVNPLTLEVATNSDSGNVPSPGIAASVGAAEKPAAAFRLAQEEGLVQSLLRKGGLPLVVFSFLGFGLLIAFTPCVFPIYPILAATLAREGDRLTARRGFVLSAIYVLSSASAFSLLGALAGWSGQNLQIVLQSPFTTGAISIAFILLALASFGFFEPRLPAGWVNWIAARTGKLKVSKASVAVLGFSSVFIIGPCVTAPLAAALLYLTQSGDMLLGAAALFALGIGKGIPLIVVGTMGASILPRAGAWMKHVKTSFGIGFLATAIWIATPLLPAGLDLVLWAALLVGTGMWAFRFATGNRGFILLARTTGLMAIIYGMILMIGAATAPTGPWQHLARLTNSAPPSTDGDLHFATVTSVPELQKELRSVSGRKPTLVYFTADWCITCRVIERSVLPHDEVRRSLEGLHLVKVDISALHKDSPELMQRLRVVGPPTMVFFDRDAREVAGTRLVGEVTAELLSRSAAKVQSF